MSIQMRRNTNDSSKATMIEVENVSFSYNNRTVLQDASFTVKKGDFLGILGPNGAGKSTLLKLILGILTPESGLIRLEGQPLKQYSGRKNIAYVSQRALSFNADFPATAGEVVALGLYEGFRFGFRKPKNEAERVRSALAKVGLENAQNKLIGRMSGGEQQRVFIARALAKEPRILFLDEPTVGVDVDTIGSICCLLGDLNKNYGITILMVTHDMSAVVGHANHILNFRKNGTVDMFGASEYARFLKHER